MRRVTTLLTVVCLLAGALAASAPAATKSGTYAGKTTQHYRVKLKVSGKTMTLVRFSAKLSCGDGSVLIDEESGFQPAKLRGGRFKETQFGNTDTVKFSGRVSGSTATGTLKVSDKEGKVRCTSPNVKFTARRQ